MVRSLPGEGGGGPGAPAHQARGPVRDLFDNGGVLRLPNPLPVGQKKFTQISRAGMWSVARSAAGIFETLKATLKSDSSSRSAILAIHKAPDANRVSGVAFGSLDADEILPSAVEPRVAPP